MRNIQILLFLFVLTYSNITLADNDNFLTYSSDNHPKALGLNITVQYPPNWEIAEGNRPHIVQKFMNTEDPDGVVMCALSVSKAEKSLSDSEWKEALELTDEEDFDVNSINLYQKTDSMKIISQRGKNGVISTGQGHAKQLDETFDLYFLNRHLYDDNKIILLTCYVYGETKIQALQAFKKYKELFLKMGDSISLNGYTSSSATISTKNNNNLNKYRYSTKGVKEALGLNVIIEFPNNWITFRHPSSSVLQAFTDNSEQRSACLLSINDTEKSLTPEEWYNVMDDTTQNMINSLKGSSNNIEVLKKNIVFYSGMPGFIIRSRNHQNIGNIQIYSEELIHSLFFENKNLILRCRINATNFDEAKNLFEKTYESVFMSIGNNITIMNKYEQ